MNNFENIEHIVNDGLPGGERDEFNARLINDPELRAEYDDYIMTLNFVNSREELLQQITGETVDFYFDIDSAFEASQLTSPGEPDESFAETSSMIREIMRKDNGIDGGKKKGWLRSASVLASLLLLFMLLPNDQPAGDLSDVSIFEFKPHLYIPWSSRQLISETQYFVAARESYFRGDAASALLLLDSAVAVGPVNNEAIMLRAVCLMECGREAEAASQLEKISEDCLLYSAALWHRAVCLVNLNEEKKALEMLDLLKSRDPGYSRSTTALIEVLHRNPGVHICFNPSSELSAERYGVIIKK